MDNKEKQSNRSSMSERIEKKRTVENKSLPGKTEGSRKREKRRNKNSKNEQSLRRLFMFVIPCDTLHREKDRSFVVCVARRGGNARL